MTPKRAIVAGMILCVVFFAGQYVYFQGQSKIRFFKNGVPLAGAEMTIQEFYPSLEKQIYHLDSEGAHDFGWSFIRHRETRWMNVKITQGTNVVVTNGTVSLPQGCKSLDFCTGSVLKATNVIKYTSFYSSISISETWPLPTNSPIPAILESSAKHKP